jgi:hypothetical protein
MNKGWIIGLGCVAVFFLAVFIIIGMVISTSNQEATLRVAIEAKQKDNTSEFDNMFKKISQVAQVSSKQMESLKEIFNGYAQARSTGGDNQVMTWVKESIPNVDTATFNNLQNIITASRDSWTMRQKELIDLSREHEKLLRLFPSNMILAMLGRKSVEIKIVTSGRTEKAFDTGKDDDTNVFVK